MSSTKWPSTFQDLYKCLKLSFCVWFGAWAAWLHVYFLFGCGTSQFHSIACWFCTCWLFVHSISFLVCLSWCSLMFLCVFFFVLLCSCILFLSAKVTIVRLAHWISWHLSAPPNAVGPKASWHLLYFVLAYQKHRTLVFGSITLFLSEKIACCLLWWDIEDLHAVHK